MDFIIVGGGIVGLATALRVLEARPDVSLLLLEKESRLGRHQTGHNSGVLHAGLYYKPGSLKAKLAVEGLRQMVDFCQKRKVPYEQCGKIVVATEHAELLRLDKLLERGTANGLKGLRKLGREQIREIEPHTAGLAAIHVPEEGIVDYGAVVEAMAGEIRRLGGEIRTGNLVVKDILGNEQIITKNFYQSPILLAKGENDFSLESGFLRKNYGTKSNDYQDGFAGEPMFMVSQTLLPLVVVLNYSLTDKLRVVILL